MLSRETVRQMLNFDLREAAYKLEAEECDSESLLSQDRLWGRQDMLQELYESFRGTAEEELVFKRIRLRQMGHTKEEIVEILQGDREEGQYGVIETPLKARIKKRVKKLKVAYDKRRIEAFSSGTNPEHLIAALKYDLLLEVLEEIEEELNDA